MKQFNVDEYLKNPNRKVITRDGKSARIICTDRVDKTHSILALLFESEGSNREEVYQYTAKGEYFSYASSPHDLFFAPEKKEGWVNIYKTPDGVSHPSEIYTSKEVAEASAKNRVYYITTIKIEWEE